jgi:hypothetical protein
MSLVFLNKHRFKSAAATCFRFHFATGFQAQFGQQYAVVFGFRIFGRE